MKYLSLFILLGALVCGAQHANAYGRQPNAPQPFHAARAPERNIPASTFHGHEAPGWTVINPHRPQGFNVAPTRAAPVARDWGNWGGRGGAVRNEARHEQFNHEQFNHEQFNGQRFHQWSGVHQNYAYGYGRNYGRNHWDRFNHWWHGSPSGPYGYGGAYAPYWYGGVSPYLYNNDYGYGAWNDQYIAAANGGYQYDEIAPPEYVPQVGNRYYDPNTGGCSYFHPSVNHPRYIQPCPGQGGPDYAYAPPPPPDYGYDGYGYEDHRHGGIHWSHILRGLRIDLPRFHLRLD